MCLNMLDVACAIDAYSYEVRVLGDLLQADLAGMPRPHVILPRAGLLIVAPAKIFLSALSVAGGEPQVINQTAVIRL
ncbi:hypothetical protein CHX26_08950 [Porphyrobacter sp. HT-58-2]|nr:hypothetical protein CHX26_08950 [Porphyrobacter sp. HT-58-2]